MSFDVGELFTVAVRRTLPHLNERKLSGAFDVRGSRVIVRADASAMQRAFHRLILGVGDLVRVGFVVLQAETQVARGARCTLELKLAGTGLQASRQVADLVLSRLQLEDDEEADAGAGQPHSPDRRRAVGVCPATGAAVQFARGPAEGLLLTAQWQLPVEAVDASEAPQAGQARAWIIDADEVAAQSLARRLQRVGWATTRFDSAMAAARRLATFNGDARPALVVAVECAGVSPGTVQSLRRYLPPWTVCVYAAVIGSPTLALIDGVPGFDVRVCPLSPMELDDLTSVLSREAELGSGSTRPAPMTFGARPVALVASHSDLGCFAGAMAFEALGYEAQCVTPSDKHFINMVRSLAPLAVLLDLADGRDSQAIERARSLRTLERLGDCAPCVLLASADDWTDQHRSDATRAGFDALLDKPLTPKLLDAELRRMDAGACLVGR